MSSLCTVIHLHHPSIHPPIHPSIHPCVLCTYVHTYMYTRARLHSYKQICTHTYVHRSVSALLLKGLSFSIKERRQLGILGLLPPAVQAQSDQVSVALQNLKRCENDLDRYIYLMGLLERNENLFFRVVNDNIELTMPLIYTPTVGLACQKYGLVLRNPMLVLPLWCYRSRCLG